MLHSDWITEKHIDFEYKSYLLLAYLKTVGSSFNQSKLFPYFPELIEHHKNLQNLKNQKLQLSEMFPKELTKIDLKEPKLEYESLLRDDKLMNAINELVEYSIPKFQHYIDEGNSIYNFVSEKINIFPVGVMPLYAKEGYMLLSHFTGGRKRASVFQYALTLFEKSEDLFCNIHTKYVATFTINISTSFQSVKTELIRKNPALPNPATFAVESELSFPVNETLLPVAKKLLVKYVFEEK